MIPGGRDATVSRQMTEKTAVFFDIDGTLLDTHGAGRDAFSNTLKAVFDHDDDLSYIHFAGATDLDLFNEIRIRSGLKVSRMQEKEFFERLPVELRKSIREHLATLCPGVCELLKELSADERVLVGLVTGNTEECAHIKLSHFNLHGHFMLGAFGREHARRPELARRARERAKKLLKRGEQLGRCFLIGDTPADIAAARAIGAVSIAVATGSYDQQSLMHAGADHVLPDLSSTDRVIDILGLNRESSQT